MVKFDGFGTPEFIKGLQPPGGVLDSKLLILVKSRSLYSCRYPTPPLPDLWQAAVLVFLEPPAQLMGARVGKRDSVLQIVEICALTADY